MEDAKSKTPAKVRGFFYGRVVAVVDKLLAMNLFDKQQRLQQRIAELREGKEIDVKHIKVLLSPAH